MKSKILIMVITNLFEHVIVPLARDYVKKTDNQWDDKALDFLVELEKYIITILNAK